VIPIAKTDDRIVVAMDDPTDSDVLTELRACTGPARRIVLATTSDVMARALGRLYGQPRDTGSRDATRTRPPDRTLSIRPRHRLGRPTWRPPLPPGTICRGHLESLRERAGSWQRRIDAVETLPLRAENSGAARWAGCWRSSGKSGGAHARPARARGKDIGSGATRAGARCAPAAQSGARALPGPAGGAARPSSYGTARQMLQRVESVLPPADVVEKARRTPGDPRLPAHGSARSLLTVAAPPRPGPLIGPW
jgi:hypothetical protein